MNSPIMLYGYFMIIIYFIAALILIPYSVVQDKNNDLYTVIQ